MVVCFILGVVPVKGWFLSIVGLVLVWFRAGFGWFCGLRLVLLQSPSSVLVATPSPALFFGMFSAVLYFLRLIINFFSDRVFFSVDDEPLVLLSCVRAGGGLLVL